MYDFAFKILGGLDPSFAQSFKQADAKIKHSNSTLKELKSALDQVEAAYRSGIIGADSFANAQTRINAKINQETQKLAELTKQQEKYKQAQTNMSSIGESIKGGAMAVGGAFSIGAVLTEVGQYQAAMGQAQAMTGAVGEVWQDIQSSVKNVYAAGFGTDLPDVANAVGQIQQILGSQIPDAIDEATQHALLLRDTFGFEVTESARAAQVMMEQFGISEKQAYTLMAQGAQMGADKNGDLLDTLNEYSVQFKQLGFDAEGFMDIIVAGAQSGVWSVDKIGDSIKEFGIRVKNGSKSTTEGFQAVGLDADVMAQKFAAGGESAQNAFIETINALKAMEDPVARNQAGVALFGTMWEDMGEDAVFAMANADAAVEMNGDTLDEIANSKMNNFSTALSKLGRSLEMYIVAPLAEQATPAIQAFSELIGQVDLSYIVAGIAGVAGAIAAFQIGGFIAGLGGLAGMATMAGAAFAFMTSPIFLVAAAIGAVIAIGVLLYTHLGEIQALGISMWAGIQAAGANFAASFMATIDELVANVKAAWESLKSFLSSPIEGTINFVKNILGGDGDVAANAKGGIYNRGAFLTTFAENSPEAAIPIDGSKRAISLWQKTGQMLGVYHPDEEFNSISPVDGKTDFASGLIPNAMEQENIAPMIPVATQSAKQKKRNLNIWQKLKGSLNNLQIPDIDFDGIIPIDIFKQTQQQQPILDLSGLMPQNADTEGIIPNDLSGFNAPVTNNSTSLNVTFAPVINVTGNADKAIIKNAVEDEFIKFKAYMARFEREKRRVSYA